MRKSLIAFSVGLLASIQSFAGDPIDWQGVKVLPKEGCVIKVENEVLDDKSFSLPYIVQQVNGEWLWIGGSKKGWVQRSQVVTLDEAPAYYTEVINRGDKSRGWAYGKRALAWTERGELDLAIADYGVRLQLHPDKVAYNNRGNAWNSKKEYDNAIADFNQVIRLDPNAGGVFCNRGNAWYGKKQYDNAIADYNEAIRLDPYNSIAYRNRGNALYRKKEFEKAFADFNEAIRLDPNDVSAYSGRGNVSNAKKEYDKAIVDFSHVLQLDPNIGSTYVDRGNSLYGKKEYDKALADYDQAIRLDPNLASSYNNIALISATSPIEKYRNGQRAVELATKACELSGWTNAHLLGTLAAAYAEAGDFENAVKHQQKAIELKPNDSEFVKEAKGRLQLYSERKPFRDGS